ncbi:hypothetical protein C8R43DRAFT_960397 [Mycena crocata]|nr:hypothetical protein C8R43DRAFT_960397 [Mycena crocata]
MSSRRSHFERIEPLLYRMLSLKDEDDQIDRPERSSQTTSRRFLKLLQSKRLVASFFHQYIHHLALVDIRSIEFQTILASCTGIPDLGLFRIRPTPALLPLFTALPLQRLYLYLWALFDTQAFRPFFQDILANCRLLEALLLACGKKGKSIGEYQYFADPRAVLMFVVVDLWLEDWETGAEGAKTTGFKPMNSSENVTQGRLKASAGAVLQRKAYIDTSL